MKYFNNLRIIKYLIKLLNLIFKYIILFLLHLQYNLFLMLKFELNKQSLKMNAKNDIKHQHR